MVDGSGGGTVNNAVPVCDKMVAVLIAIRKADGTLIGEYPTTAKIGDTLFLDESFNAAAFEGDASDEIIGTVCIKEIVNGNGGNNSYKKKPLRCAIVSASLQIYAVEEGEGIETDSLTPILPLGYFAQIKF
jgi:hypothetical protein